jgi:hypothetical protein
MSGNYFITTALPLQPRTTTSHRLALDVAKLTLDGAFTGPGAPCDEGAVLAQASITGRYAPGGQAL